MPIVLDHTIVPARDKEAAARLFARLFGLPYDGPSGHFAPVRVNDTLTFDFDQFDEGAAYENHHYAFHVDEATFDAVLGRVKAEGLTFGSHPWSPENGELNSWNGGRGVYFRTPDGHLLELLTRR